MDKPSLTISHIPEISLCCHNHVLDSEGPVPHVFWSEMQAVVCTSSLWPVIQGKCPTFSTIRLGNIIWEQSSWFTTPLLIHIPAFGKSRAPAGVQQILSKNESKKQTLHWNTQHQLRLMGVLRLWAIGWVYLWDQVHNTALTHFLENLLGSWCTCSALEPWDKALQLEGKSRKGNRHCSIWDINLSTETAFQNNLKRLIHPN